MRKHRKIVLSLLAALVLTAGVLFAAGYFGWLRLPEAIQAQIDILPDIYARTGTLHAGEETDVGPGYRVVINQTPCVRSGEKECNIEFENPAENSYNARIALYLDDTGELLANTKRVDPGKYIKTLKLKKELSPGDYPITVRLDLFDGKKLNLGFTFAVTLRVME